MKRNLALALVLQACSGCSFTQEHHVDQICRKIVEFANSTPAGEEHSVVLVGGWGGETPNTLNTHKCTFSGYAAGETFCSYLLPNSSWEFGELNAKRTFACLDSPSEKAALTLLEHDSLSVEANFRTFRGLENGVSLRIEFGPRPNPEHSSLRFVVRRE